MKRYLEPGSLWFAIGAFAVLGVASSLLQQAYPGDRSVEMLHAASQLARAVAYALAALLCHRIGRDHEPASLMRLAWWLMGASSVCALVRHCFEAVFLITGWSNQMPTTLLGLRQVPIVLSLLLLTAGLVCLWSSFTHLGLGLHLKVGDYLLAVAMLTGVVWLLSLNQAMNDARSIFPAIRAFQSAAPLLLAAPALVGLVLYRTSQELEGGELAVSLRYMVAFLVLRLVALALGISPGLATYQAARAISRAADVSVPWVFLLAVTVRWRLTLAAQELAARYDAHPEREIVLMAKAEE